MKSYSYKLHIEYQNVQYLGANIIADMVISQKLIMISSFTDVVVLVVGVEHLAGVPPLDRDPDRSKLSRKFRARRASLCISRARLDPGL